MLETELPRGLALALVPELVLGLDKPGFGYPPVAAAACCTPARMGDCCRYDCSYEVGASAIASAARLVEAVFGREKKMVSRIHCRLGGQWHRRWSHILTMSGPTLRIRRSWLLREVPLQRLHRCCRMMGGRGSTKRELCLDV